MNVHILGTVENNQLKIVNFGPILYFASFILIGAMIIMNLFIGVIMNSMEESQKELSQELRNIEYKEKNTDELYKHIISRLDELNTEIKELKNTKQKLDN